MRIDRLNAIAGFLLCAALGAARAAGAATDDDATRPATVPIRQSANPAEGPLQRLADQLPSPISDGLDIEGWVWLADLQDNFHPPHNFYDGMVSLSITKSFDQRIAVSGEGNFIDANGERRAELEQGFVSIKLWDAGETVLTAGKFNANFGLEARDFWNRRTGTTSLLFNAQPQDLIGVMVTQPIGDTGVTLRPFLSADFQGGWSFNQSPSAGLTVEYKPTDAIDVGVTNWVGPGFVEYGGRPLPAPYSAGGYGAAGDSVVENWQGPSLDAERGGTVYFLEAKASWNPVPDLMIGAEYLLARTAVSDDPTGWEGWMVMADWSVTDRLHVFGRYSRLNDWNWLVTGVIQNCTEASCGFGWELTRDVEFRAEYRHDFSSVTPDFDSVSVHLTFAF